MKRHIFICYQHEDNDFAEVLINRIEKAGFTTWIDDNHLRAGEDWRTEIDQAIKNALALIVIMSPKATASEYVTYEWAFAWGAGVKVIPVLYKETPLHPRLEALQYLNFTDRVVRPWDTLINTLTNLANISPLSSTLPAQNPKDAKPITIWRDRDEAFLQVEEGIRRVVEEPREGRSPQDGDRTNKISQLGSPRCRFTVAFTIALVLLLLLGGISAFTYLREVEGLQASATATAQANVHATATPQITASAIATGPPGPPLGFSVTTLHDEQVIRKQDIPLKIQGTYSSEGSGQVWVLLEDTFGQFYLQNPVQFQPNGRWIAQNIRPSNGTTQIDFVYVTAEANAVFQQKVANGDFGAFRALPVDSRILRTIRIQVLST